MTLRSKLLLGFISVLVIFMGVGAVVVVALNNIDRQSNAVDNVDSALFDALRAQGDVVRFILYQDSSYADNVEKSLAASAKRFEMASPLLITQENKALLEAQRQTLQQAGTILKRLVALDKKTN